MQKRIPIKNHQQEIQLIAKRAWIGLIIICMFIILLIFRLAYLQVYKHSIYSTLSTKNWLDLVPVEPTRGLIYDRKGVLLAENIPVFSLDVIPVRVNNLPLTIQKLSKIISLSENDISQFQKQIKQHRRFDEVPLKLRLTEQEVARFTENQHTFPGVLVKARLIRHYPYNETFSHVLGYVGRINSQELNDIDTINYSASNYIGKLGIEKFYEEELHGTVGYEQVESDASGKPIRVLKEIKGTPGKNIYLTLDSDLQRIAEKALGNHRGAIVAIEPETGEVLAMVSKPGYDPNAFVTGISQKDYQALQTSTDKPLYNRALRGLYPLASTIKPFLALQGLESNIITAAYSLFDKGWFQLPNNNHRYHDMGKGHGMINLSRAIIASCDTYFYDLANRMGIRAIDDILRQFGFGETTGIDLEGEEAGIVASPEWKLKTKYSHWYDGDTIITGIGQGFMLATPLQMAAATATLSLRGKRLIPHLLLGQQTPGETYVTQPTANLEPINIQNPEHWNIIIKAMQEVISSRQGTAHRFSRNLAYTVAGKTGTGQVISKRRNPDEADDQNNLPEKLRDHHLFVAFAPVDKPKLALAIITENSNAVLETARTVFDYYLGHKKNVNR